MNRDLEKQLNEMGPEYRAVVARLRAGLEAKGREDFRRKTRDVRGRETRDGRRGLASYVFRLRSYLTAASLLVVLGLSAILIQSNDRTIEQSNSSPFGAREYRASVSEMIATQNPDGSWKNDFLTRRNAAALKVCGDPAAQIAYKKAMRNLRTRGVL